MRNYAVPLNAVIREDLLEPRGVSESELMDMLQAYFSEELSIKCLDLRIVGAESGDRFLVFFGVEDTALPPLLALADVQNVALFTFRQDDEEQFSLRPLILNRS